MNRPLLDFVSTHMRRPSKVAACGLLLLALTACGGEHSTPAPPSAEELRNQVVETLRNVTSVSFQVSHPNDGTDMGGGLVLNTVEGIAVFPKGASMTANGIIARIAVSFGIVQTDDTTYFSGPIGDTWRLVPPETLPFDFVGMNTSVATALGNATALAIAPGASVSGQPTFVLSGSIISDDLKGLVPGAALGLPLSIEGWIGQDDALPWRVVLTGALIGSDPESMVRHLNLHNFDEPMTIDPPI